MTEAKKGPRLREVSGLIRVLFHRLAHAAALVHETDPNTMGQRALLEDLLRNGPQTIPRLAGKRPVSRQHILGHVHPLKEKGYVEFQENPEHKRSFLVALTPRGRSSIEAMVRREDRVFQELARSFKLDELSQAAEVLGTLKSLLEDGNVQRVLKKARPRSGGGGADS